MAQCNKISNIQNTVTQLPQYLYINSYQQQKLQREMLPGTCAALNVHQLTCPELNQNNSEIPVYNGDGEEGQL